MDKRKGSKISTGNNNFGGENMQAKQFGDTWIQKASWKTLVGDGMSVNFSLSNMLASGQHQPPSPVMPCTDGVPERERNQFHSSASTAAVKTRPIEEECTQSEPRSKISSNEATQIYAEKISGDSKVKKEGTDAGVFHPASTSYKTCNFMRSPNAEKEWLECKRMLKDVAKSRRKTAVRSSKKLYKPF